MKIILQRLLFVSIVFLLAYSNVSAQSDNLFIPRNIQKAYDKGTRSPDGRMEKNYWQNFSDYYIRVKFNPKTRLVEGEAIITYYNNSPDTLKKLVFRLAPNFYKKGVKRNVAVEPADVGDGVKISKLLINSRSFDINNPNDVAQEGTILKARGTKIEPRGGRATVEVNWSYTLNKGSHSRTGQIDEGSYFLAYFFPRITVYDDTEGWDEFEYMGEQETYFELSSFNVFVTVPKNYMVWGTGNLENPAEVLHESVLKKWTKALLSDKPLFIIDSADIKNKTISLKKKWNTFNFKTTAPDFVFALSDHYLWQGRNLVVDSSDYRKSFVTTAFNPIHKDFFEVNDISAKTLQVMSFDFPGVPYPYPHLTVVDGLDQMEYPMMINDNPTATRFDAITLTDHEIFHQLFPFWMGTNQTKYGWMDEGWATLGEWYISPLIDTTIVDDYGMDAIEYFSGLDWDTPIITSTTELSRTRFINNYPKPALTYLYLWDMLGDSLFKSSLRFYMSEWNGKHPTPWDFFNCMNTASGKNLNWFWNAWYYQHGFPDLGIKSADKTEDGYSIKIESIGNKPVPVNLFITYTDNSTSKAHQTVEVWKDGNKFSEVIIKTDKKIKSITLGDVHDGDTDKKNNKLEMSQ